MSAVVLDTDVASQLLRDRLVPSLATKLIGRIPVVTFVTLGELTTWVTLRHWGPSRVAWPHSATERHLDRRMLSG